ncbi:hypothetical protein Taro_007343 [Colocasia esculenta]|uniref:Uncharacterized protein n=1 Tax=Colocasia esculenta TaxID=4460 RepID=A0A843U054_COLES|nr:hypothetical protein [Colocasia esculenta]
MLVCCVALLVERCYTCLWLLSALCWLVVNSGELLPEFFSVGSGGSEGLRCAVRLAGAFWRVFPERCLGGSGGGSPRTCLHCFCSSTCCSVFSDGPCCWPFGLCVLVKVLPRIAPFFILAEVLPRSARCSFWATVMLPLWFEVCRLVGLHSGEVLPGQLLALLVEDFVCPCGRVVCFASRALRALPDGGLEEACGVSSSSIFHGLLRLVVLYHGFWCHVAHRGDLRGEGPFPLSYLEVELVGLLVRVISLRAIGRGDLLCRLLLCRFLVAWLDDVGQHALCSV